MTPEKKELERLRKEVAHLNEKLSRAKSLRLMRENPSEWEKTEDARAIARNCPFMGLADFEAYFPQDFKKQLPEEGTWIQVQKPPHTEITVPPFSIWFATPWSMERESTGLQAKRVKITTPSGEIGIMPHEYRIEEDMTNWLGREAEGVWVRQLNGNPVCNVDSLFYLMSRGVSRRAATMLLINQIKDPTFLWVEIAPQYGEYFGKEWPSPKRCPFCTPREQFIADANELLRA